MTQTEPGGIVPANDNGPVDPDAKARADALVFALASALGRQIAREEFARREHGRAANDNLPLPGLGPGGKDRPEREE
ncbi:hypothetical protein GLI01_00150 [Gluconacetobacter liquefaciens]|uniref:Uncharacterized protein n=1 Tax=Gluconacetobacter liquefaciens TaxID=89584 RepID=A0A370G8R7_GLULI|nr:hypothetical protein [Gluconacetobacter liquefaciens]MBB2185536.1 hypothetical protein [Gluconacetobacter liquefaciens]RDI39339.1 hypothetical protein C7453_102126 [Gluconacetobacter liquefaciens]GBR00203.1 hypothetical protein AA0522_1347 [Gluconacetobacter liquefaciens NRIC 0522]GEB35980.1 hypothetical protein GLI01_00150 [Gluconacetobacter liquefaciens]